MAHGQFFLYYLDTYGGRHPSKGSQYQIVNDSGTEIASGTTGSNGETAQFSNASATAVTAVIKIKESNTGRYYAPAVRVEDQSTSQIHIEVPGNGVAGVSTGTVTVLAFQRVKLTGAANNKPIAGATFKAFLVDNSGKRVRARDSKSGQLIAGTTDAKGLTEAIWCNDEVSFEFTYPGSTVVITSAYLPPLAQGGKEEWHEVPFKTVAATTAPNANFQVPLAGVTSAPVIVNPQTQELLVVPRKDFEEFEKFSGQFDAVLRTKHQAHADLTKALESGDAEAVAAAEKALGLAEDKVKDTLNKNFKQLASIREVFTFETTSSGKLDGKPKTELRRRYINDSRYLELKNNRLNREQFSIKLTVKDIDGSKKKEYEAKGATGVEAASKLPAAIEKANAAAEKKAEDDAKADAAKSARQDKAREHVAKQTNQPAPKPLGPNAVDRKELMGSISKVVGELKTKLLDEKGYVTLDLPGYGGQLADSIEHSESFDTEYQAQWLRLVGSAGTQSEMDWRKGQVGVTGNLQGKVVACEGSYAMHYAVPSRAGWMMTCAGQDLGAIRIYLELSLYGFVGAKVALEGSATLKFVPGIGPSLEGKPRDKSPNYTDMVKTAWKDKDKPIKLPRFEADAENTKMPDGSGVKASVDAFVGVEGGITPKGSLQWLPPQEKEFVSFAEVAFDVALSAGAGARANFHMYYANGKFRFKVAAGVTWGLGAKGALDFVVNTDKMFQMLKWLVMQLQHVGFKQLVFVNKEAFDALSQIMVMVIGEQTPLGQALLTNTEAINRSFDDVLEAIDRSDAREKMLNGILNSKPHWLVYATPETRGMLLYQLTRHWKYDHVRDSPTVSAKDKAIHFLNRRKQALIAILKPVQQTQEWVNVFQHMTEKGTKITTNDPGHNEGDVIRLLNSGIYLKDNIPTVFEKTNAGNNADLKDLQNSYLNEFFKIKASLKEKFPKGYKVSMYDTPMFEMSGTQTAQWFGLAEWKDDNINA